MTLPVLEPLLTLPDEHGGPLTDFLHAPAQKVLYVRWYGNLTGREVTYVARESLKLQAKLQYPLVFNDKSLATGDWSEAMDYLEYEWLPLAIGQGLRGIAYLFSPDMHNQLASMAFFERVRLHLPIQMFYDVPTAWHWLRQQRGYRKPTLPLPGAD